MASLTGRSKTAELNSQQLLIIRISQRYERVIGREIARAMREYARKIDEPMIADTVNAKHRANLTRILTRLWNESGTAFSERLFNVAKSKNRITEIKQDITTPIIDAAIANFIRIYGGQKITQIARTTMSDIALVVAAGVSEGLGERAIGRMIEEVAPSKSASRAQTIARTEVHGSGQGISLDVAKESEIQMEKIWITSIDERTREEHIEADGQQVGLSDTFEVGGERLEYPGDPGGSAENIINCRCVVGYNVV